MDFLNVLNIVLETRVNSSLILSRFDVLTVWSKPQLQIRKSAASALAFDVEYSQWLDENNRRINELKGAVNSHAGNAELHIILEGILAQYDGIFRIKSDAAKADAFSFFRACGRRLLRGAFFGSVGFVRLSFLR